MLLLINQIPHVKKNSTFMLHILNRLSFLIMMQLCKGNATLKKKRSNERKWLLPRAILLAILCP